MHDYKKIFLLNPDITYLNHGSFGGCPKEIMDKYFELQLKLENQPIDFLANNIEEASKKSRKSLAEYVDCDKDDIVFFPNPSTATNMVAKSLQLNKGDEVLTTNHEYGALVKTWKYICQKSEAKYIEYTPSLPLGSKEDFVEEFVNCISDKTKIIFISHITSPTGLIFPVKQICAEARKRNIISIVDGAHAPAHIDLSINDINPDIYVGACHKWMLSPKGSSFLYAHKKIQKKLMPLVISWGWESDRPGESTFLDHHQWQGTNDFSPYLIIPEVINFLKKYDWNKVSRNCRQLNLKAREDLLKLFNTSALCHDVSWIGQMSSILLPSCDSLDIYKYLKSKRIEVPIVDWGEHQIIRISIQAYNTLDDTNQLINSLKGYFKL